ncbi:hypothetical protein NEAUS03_2286 [Nematocida ausubeli]|nr:hypothetical protein NEAUS03_2286 [Nematocida ausubeli]
MNQKDIQFSVQETNCEPHQIWCEEKKRTLGDILRGVAIFLIVVAFIILLLKHCCRRLSEETHSIIYSSRGTNGYRPGLSTIQEQSMTDSNIQSARSQARGNVSITVQTLHNTRARLNNPAYTNRQDLSPLIHSSRPGHFPPTYDEAIQSITSSVGSNTAEQSAPPTYIEAVTRST